MNEAIQFDSSNLTLSGEITINLRDAIITGQIPQGSKLSETRLAKELDVSRGPLREAIRSLEGMNLIQHVPQQGSKVVVINKNLILDIYATREALEGKAASQAATHMSSAEIEEMNRLLDVQSKHMRDNDAAAVSAESDYAFHEQVIRGSKNKVLSRALLTDLYNLIKMFRYQHGFARYSTTNSLVEHRQIAYAIEQRDPILAETSMRRHIVHARDRIARLMK